MPEINDVFECACCHGLFVSGDQVRAEDEAATYFGDDDAVDELVVVCEGCYGMLRAKHMH